MKHKGKEIAILRLTLANLNRRTGTLERLVTDLREQLASVLEITSVQHPVRRSVKLNRKADD